MKLFYRAGGSWSKLFFNLLLNAPGSVPTSGRAQSAFVFPALHENLKGTSVLLAFREWDRRG